MSAFLLDTNVVSELTRPAPDVGVTQWLDCVDESLLYLSVLTLGEIRKGIAILSPGKRRAELESWLASELTPRFAGRILPIDEGIADRWGQLVGEAQLDGVHMPVIDSLLAASALEHNMTIISRNARDFRARGLAVFNPWERPGI